MNLVNDLGCNLSPLFFCLFIAEFGRYLNKSGLGINIGLLNICCILFADDLVIFAKNKASLNKLMTMTRKFFNIHKLSISETKSKIMTYNASTEEVSFSGEGLETLTLGEVMVFKYLGIHVSSASYALFKAFNENVIKKAHSYLNSMLSLVRSGPDRSQLAYLLWTSCALPSILYGTEIMPLRQETIHELEKYNSMVGKFMLQLPRSSANVTTYIDAGLRPIWSLVAEKAMLFNSKVMKKPHSNWARVAMDESINEGISNPYIKYLLQWRMRTNCHSCDPKVIKRAVRVSSRKFILQEKKRTSTTSFALNTVDDSKPTWFKPKPWVNDSGCSKILSLFRACNSGLGNRGPAKNGEFYKLCPLCQKVGIIALNNEVKQIFVCTKSITLFLFFLFFIRTKFIRRIRLEIS